MITKAIDAIAKSDLDSLLSNAVAESRTLDYKLTLPGGKDEDRKEFLADASSFANAGGGDIVFGMEESGGVPVAIPGLAGVDPDAEILRLDEMLRTGIEPRMPGVQMRAVAGFATGPVLILRIPRSFASPHMVSFKRWSRFYGRSSAGKFQLDVAELRSAFAAAGDLSEQFQRFRTDRLSRIIASETPVAMNTGPKMVLHVIPFSTFAVSSNPGNNLREVGSTQLRPIAAGGWSHRHNIDGVVSYSGSRRGGGPSDSYCQLFRSGAVEAVYGDLVRERDDRKWIASVKYELDLIQATSRYLADLASIGVLPPALVLLSMTGVRGVEMYVDPRYYDLDSAPIDRDVLLMPDVIADQFDVDVPTLLRPVFDAVWNAAGYERSFNYDEHGAWRERP